MQADTPERSWSETALVYTRPNVMAMAFLGFSAGLPLLLVFSTLTAWLTDGDIKRSTIGFFAWVGITYSVKVLWAPVVDSMAVPVLTKTFGQRRGWMLLGQIGIGTGLVLMALTGPVSIPLLSAAALLVAFSSATQDVAIDAFRIESAEPEYQGAMSASYVFGYRIAMLVAGAGALSLADNFNWVLAYLAMAALVLVGVMTVMLVTEPVLDRVSEKIEFTPPGLRRWFTRAVIGPFVDFFVRNQKTAIIILVFIAVFRLSDIAMGIMANPFYLDMGYTKSQIAAVAKIFGFFMTIAGSFVCGALVVKWGLMRPLLIGAIAVASTNLLFAGLSQFEPRVSYLAIVISADNLSGGFAATAFIAYLSSLTNRAYTATQYALFSSLMTLPGKFLSGFSGMVVENFGYYEFFIVAALLGVPAVGMVIWLGRIERQKAMAPSHSGAG